MHTTETQLRGYACMSLLGDATAADGDLIPLAQRSPATRDRFAWTDR